MINLKKDIILENDRVRLEPLIFEHFEGLYKAGDQDEKLLQHSFNHVHSRELLTDYLDKFIAERRSGIRYPFAIYDKRKGEFAGVTTLMGISTEHKRLEIGSTWIGRKFQRTGLNRHCKFLLLSYCFEEAAAERVELKTDARNEQSKTAIRKIGGKFEGELRNHSLMPNGFRRNTCIYSILRSEWLEIKKLVFKEFLK